MVRVVGKEGALAGGGGAVALPTKLLALPTKLLSQVIKYSSVGSAVAFLGQITLFKGRRPSEKRAKLCFLNGRYSPVILRIVMYVEVDKMNLPRHYFQIGIIFCAKTNNKITVKKSPWHCDRDHSSAFVYWISVGTRTYIHGYKRGKRTHD